jgi:hypothetical protein
MEINSRLSEAEHIQARCRVSIIKLHDTTNGGHHMARSKKSGVLATIKYPLAVQIREPEFEMLDTVRHLDVKALASAAKAEIGLGYINTCCQRQLVRAVIRKGMVTGLSIDEPPRKDRTPVSSDLAKLLKEARRTMLKRHRAGPKFPIPVTQFFGKGVAYDMISVQTLQCIRICIFGTYCITCCWRTDLPGSEAICGHITIDTTVLD